MYQIYHAPNTRGIRAIWLCEELNVPYEVIHIDFSPAYRATPEWRALNPVGKVPVLVDGDLTMFESGAMVDHILALHDNGGLLPAPGTHDYALCRQWSWFAESTLARPLGEIVNHGREFPGDAAIPAVLEEMKNRSALAAEAVAEHMQDREYLLPTGFTAADIMMGYSLFLVEMLIPERMPAGLKPYYERLRSRPGFEIALTK